MLLSKVLINEMQRMMEMKSIQISLTPAAGKQLIALALAQNEALLCAAKEHTVVIVAGTTNTYIAREVLNALGETGFTGQHFFRGIVSGQPVPADLPEMDGDVVIEKGRWIHGKTVQEAAPELKAGDMILKGANAVDLKTGQAAVLIGHPMGGTLAAIQQAAIGRRVQVLIPVGVEKRVDGPVGELCQMVNDPQASGARLALAPGKAYTELDAIRELTGAEAKLIAGGGVCGYEGIAWFQCMGTDEALSKVKDIILQVKDTPAYHF